MTILVGTAGGVHGFGAREEVALAGLRVTALVPDDGELWALVDGGRVHRGDGRDWTQVARVAGPRGTCLLPTPRGLLVGTEEAHLLRVTDGGAEPVPSFDAAPGRGDWYTPWGGPPDTRSLALDPSGAVYANVHVGGILRSDDGGETWHPTIDIDADVHQVVVHPEWPGRVLAATAVGLAESVDGGRTWTFADEGLHAGYCRAVSVAGDHVVVSACAGPHGGRAGIYRRPITGPAPFERCRAGLPPWFRDNIDTHWLAAEGSTVCFASPEGDLFVSTDLGAGWERVATRLPPVSCVVLV